MQDVSKGEGRTVLFVSHNMGSVRNLCKTGILLDKGMVKYSGDIVSTINEYQKSVVAYGFSDGDDVTTEKVSLLKFDILDGNDNSIDVILSGMDFKIVVEVQNNTDNDIDDIDEFTVSIESLFGEGLIVVNNVQLGRRLTLKKGINRIEFPIRKFSLTSGEYRVGLYISNTLGQLCATEVAKVITVDATSYYGEGKIHFNTRFLVDYDMIVHN